MQVAANRRFEDVKTLGALCEFNAAVRPNREAFLFEGRSTSYGEFDALVNQVANGLIAAGLKAGARIAYLGKTSDLYFQLVFGAAKAAAVLVGVNWRLAPPEVAYLLNDCRAQLLFVGPEFWPLVEQIQDRIPNVARIVAMVGGHAQWQAFEDWRDVHRDVAPTRNVDELDVSIQMYTSGTTGRPKGVLLAHRSFFAMKRLPPAPDMEFDDWSERDVSLVAMPSYHIGGVGWGIAGFRAGARNVIIREFDPGLVLETIQRYGVTMMFLVPSAMRMVLQHPRAPTTSYDSLRYITYAASPIPLDLLREALRVFKCGFVQLYGMTETTGGATYLPPCDHDIAGNERMRSAGKPLPGVRLKIVDRTGKPLPPRALGEICISSPANMTGYWTLEKETAATLVDGFVHSGDIGYLDEDGYVYVLDRVKDMILSGGENIAPIEIETALSAHPGVAEVAVIGVPDERWGEAVKAFVVLAPGAKLTSSELMSFGRERIGGFKVPKTIDFVASLPRNPSGKVLRRELRERCRFAGKAE